MRRSALILVVVLLGVFHVALADDTRRVNGVAIGEALRDFLSDVRTNVKSDVATWSDRVDKMRKQIQSANNDDEFARRRLLTDPATVQNVKDHLARTWEVILEAGGSLKNILDAKKLKVHEFLSDILGKNWGDFTPGAWHDGSFSWDKLGTFEYKTSLTDFLSSDTLMSFNKPTNLADVQDKLDAVADIFCTPESYNPIQKWPTICYGPVVNITYAPKACIIDEEAKQVICEPARLVLTKTPGYCVLKHYSSASWTGKECKISGMVGFQKLKIAGGTNYTIDLGELATDKMESLKEFWDNHMAPPPS